MEQKQEKIKLSRAVLVEGKYDKIKLASLLDACILTTEGFGIFKNKEKLAYLKRIAAEKGLIVLTDADSGGLLIRNYVRSVLPPEQVVHLYIPPRLGKERRKKSPGKEGLLGVEGSDAAALRALFLPFAQGHDMIGACTGVPADMTADVPADMSTGACADGVLANVPAGAVLAPAPAGAASAVATSASAPAPAGAASAVASPASAPAPAGAACAAATPVGAGVGEGVPAAPASASATDVPVSGAPLSGAVGPSSSAVLLTRMDFYLDGFCGGKESARRRKQLARAADLPENLSAKALLEAFNLLGGRAFYESCKSKL